MSATASVLHFPGGTPAALLAHETEQALLGALLIKPDLLRALPATFHPDHYGHPWHGDVHRAIVEVGVPGVPAMLPVCQALAVNDPELRAYIVSLVQAMVSLLPAGIGPYADQVTDMHRRRGIVALADEMRAGAFASIGAGSADTAIARALTGLDSLTSASGGLGHSMTFNQAMDAAMDKADEASRLGGPSGLRTGMASVDAALGGLEDGTMTVLAGRPGMGKSALAHGWALSAARRGVGVLEISLEMSAMQLGRRSLSAAAGVPLRALKAGQHGPYANRLLTARRELNNLPLTIEDGGGLTSALIALKARAAKRRHGLGLIMVDHLHIVRPDDADARHGGTWAVGRISGAMKRLAKEFECPVLLLAQLNRGVEGRDDKRPGLGDLRQSGDIEQDADAVCFIYRAEYYMGNAPEPLTTESREQFANRLSKWEATKRAAAGKADLIIAKARDDAPGTVPLLFDGATTSFSEPTYGE